MTTTEHNYTARAATVIVDAVREEHDFGGWLAQVLATAAAELGSSTALIAGRPGSWEPSSCNDSGAGPSAGTTTTSPTTPRSSALELL